MTNEISEDRSIGILSAEFLGAKRCNQRLFYYFIQILLVSRPIVMNFMKNFASILVFVNLFANDFKFSTAQLLPIDNGFGSPAQRPFNQPTVIGVQQNQQQQNWPGGQQQSSNFQNNQQANFGGNFGGQQNQGNQNFGGQLNQGGQNFGGGQQQQQQQNFQGQQPNFVNNNPSNPDRQFPNSGVNNNQGGEGPFPQQQPPFAFAGPRPAFTPLEGGRPRQDGVELPHGVQVIDQWNPLAPQQSTPNPSASASPRPGEVIVKISPGQLIGQRHTMGGLYWSPERDPREQIPADRLSQEPYPMFGQWNMNATIFSFLGVPYAQKPVGNLRFKQPQKLPKFATEVLYATKYPPACAQNIDARPTLWFEEPYPYDTNEDCLYLNIFTPRVSKSDGVNYPVIVFFHGGGFQTGSANDWPGYLLATKGVVVVTVNYRLGPFGFLSLGEKGSGNNGLWDQRLALDWVREYVYAFGGDRNRVTIVGHDAGAVSAGLHMLSPFSKDLFHAVAAMSGADVSYHQVITNPWLAYNNTIKLGRQVGCTQYTAREVMDCLLTRSTQDLVEGARDMLVEFNRYAFLPFVDQNFIPDAPQLMLHRKQVNNPVPYLTGVCRQDGTETLLSDRDLARTRFTVDEEYLDHKILDYVIKHNYTMNREAMIQAIKYLYTYWPNRQIDYKQREQYIYMCTDAYYTAPVSLAAQMRSEAGSIVYMYVNSYNFSTGALNPNQYFLPYWMGVCHECDLMLLFGFPWMPTYLLPAHLRNVRWTAYDKNMSEVFMSMWQQFAKKKDPNLPNDNQWFNYAPRDHWYLDLNVTRRLMRDFDWEHVAFWNVYIEQLALLVTTTFSPTMIAIRKELIALKATTGTFVVLCCIALTVAASLAYLLFEKRKRQKLKELRNGASSSASTVKYQEYEPPGYARTSIL